MVLRLVRIAHNHGSGQLGYVVLHYIHEAPERLKRPQLLIKGYVIKPALQPVGVAVNESGDGLTGKAR